MNPRTWRRTEWLILAVALIGLVFLIPGVDWNEAGRDAGEWIRATVSR